MKFIGFIILITVLFSCNHSSNVKLSPYTDTVEFLYRGANDSNWKNGHIIDAIRHMERAYKFKDTLSDDGNVSIDTAIWKILAVLKFDTSKNVIDSTTKKPKVSPVYGWRNITPQEKTDYDFLVLPKRKK